MNWSFLFFDLKQILGEYLKIDLNYFGNQSMTQFFFSMSYLYNQIIRWPWVVNYDVVTF